VAKDSDCGTKSGGFDFDLKAAVFGVFISSEYDILFAKYWVFLASIVGVITPANLAGGKGTDPDKTI
jgi:hypothetical protein